MKNKEQKFLLILFLSLLITNTSLLSYSLADDPKIEPTTIQPPEVTQRIETQPEDIPNFKSPLCLLVGLSNSELAYQEISNLSGFELFSVPYRSDIKALVDQVKPEEVIIKHPSGFVGLYTPDGQLIRGIKTNLGDPSTAAGALPQSIIQPTEANPIFENLYYPGGVTGSIPHGGLGYTPQPTGRGVKRHLLKLGSLLGLAPFQYPGYFMAYSTYKDEKLFSSLLLPQVPHVLGAINTYTDSKLDEAEYNQARNQPRDYMFQPVIEGY